MTYSLTSLLHDAQEYHEQHVDKLNPMNYIEKLILSHAIDSEEDAKVLFDQMMQNSHFFDTENMPPQWSIRSYSSAMEALEHFFNDKDMKEKMVAEYGDTFVKELMSFLVDKKKHYMKVSKKKARDEKKRVENVPNVESDQDDVLDIDISKLQEDDDSFEKPHAPVVSSVPNEVKPVNDIRTHVQKLSWIISKCVEIEGDEFKKLVYDLMLKEVNAISELI